MAAGVTWTSRTLKAEWAAGRAFHTSVIDAAGAIYVIGGSSMADHSLYFYPDVWASTDGGARPDSVQGRSVGYCVRTTRGYYNVLKGT